MLQSEIIFQFCRVDERTVQVDEKQYWKHKIHFTKKKLLNFAPKIFTRNNF